MRIFQAGLVLAGAVFALLAGGPVNQTVAGTVAGTYQDSGSKSCSAATSCQLNLAVMQFDTRLTSISCKLVLSDVETPNHFFLKEFFLAQTGKKGGKIYLSQIQFGAHANGASTFQVYAPRPNYGVEAGNRPYIKATLLKPLNVILKCGITGQ